MAYDPITGKFKPEDDSVASRVTGLTSTDSPLMQAAGTQAAQASNRRGLMNSSMGVQAGQRAALDVALPIASQEAQQAHQRRLQGRDIQSQQQIARMNVAASERNYAANMATSFENSYALMIGSIMQNEQLPADVRQRYMDHAAAVRDSNLRLVEQMYGITLNWTTPRAGSGGDPDIGILPNPGTGTGFGELSGGWYNDVYSDGPVP